MNARDKDEAWLVARRTVRCVLLLMAIALAGCLSPPVAPTPPATIGAQDAYAVAAASVGGLPLSGVGSWHVHPDGNATRWAFGFLDGAHEIRVDVDGAGRVVPPSYDPAFYVPHEVPIRPAATNLDSAAIAAALDDAYGDGWHGKAWHLSQRHEASTPFWEVGALNVDPPMLIVDPGLCTWTSDDRTTQAGSFLMELAVLPATPVSIDLVQPCGPGELQVAVSDGLPAPVEVSLVGPYGDVPPTEDGWNWLFRTGQGTWRLEVTSDLPTVVTYATAQPEA